MRAVAVSPAGLPRWFAVRETTAAVSPSGPDVHPVTWSAAPQPNHGGPRGRTTQPIWAEIDTPDRCKRLTRRGSRSKGSGWSESG